MGIGAFRRRRRRNKVARGPHGQTILALHDDLEGLLSYEESAFLFLTAAGKRRIVEVGSYRGKSCVLLTLGSTDSGGKVTAIDPHLRQVDDRAEYADDDAETLRAAIARHGVGDRVDHKVMTSAEARAEWPADKSIDMLWIDGDHSYEGAKHDFEAWKDLVAPGGVIAGHDYKTKPGVKRAWDETVATDSRFGPTRFARTISWADRLA